MRHSSNPRFTLRDANEFHFLIMDGGQGGISPMTRMLQEVLTVLKAGGAEEIAGILKPAATQEQNR